MLVTLPSQIPKGDDLPNGSPLSLFVIANGRRIVIQITFPLGEIRCGYDNWWFSSLRFNCVRG